MPMKPTPSAKAAQLRGRAETRLRQRRKNRSSQAGAPSPVHPERLLHELQVHQVELEMQNAELQEARDRTETLLEKYTELYDFAPVGYFSLAADSIIQLVNLTGARLVGVERSRLLGRPFAQHVAAHLQPAFRAFLARVFAGETKQSCEVTLLNTGQPPRTAHIKAERSRDGRECRAVVTDITKLKQAEEVLRRNEALLSALIEHAPVGVYVLDERLRLQQINSKARPVFNKIHPLLGRGIAEILHLLWPKKSADQVMARFQETLQTGKPYFAPDFSERRRDIHATESYEWQLQRITLPSGEHKVVCYFNDITERKRAEVAQRRLEVLAASNRSLEREIVRRQAVEKALKKSQQHQGRLLNQSHRMQRQLRQLSHQILRTQEEERKRISRELHDEISQILVGIKVQLETLTREATVQPRRLRLKVARTQRLVEKSVNMVHQFARELRPAALDHLGLIPSLHSFMESFTKQTGIHARLKAYAVEDQLDTAARTVLYRVAQEALTNVARHAQASRVEVSLQKLPDCVTMRIKDDGRSFNVERFLHRNGGKRLGLVGMRERLEMVGGNFGVESVAGKGTAIVARIPLGKLRGGGGGRIPLLKPVGTKA